jgi:hypothetical protein
LSTHVAASAHVGSRHEAAKVSAAVCPQQVKADSPSPPDLLVKSIELRLAFGVGCIANHRLDQSRAPAGGEHALGLERQREQRLRVIAARGSPRGASSGAAPPAMRRAATKFGRLTSPEQS